MIFHKIVTLSKEKINVYGLETIQRIVKLLKKKMKIHMNTQGMG